MSNVKVKRTLTQVINPKFNIYSKIFLFPFVCPVFKSLLLKLSSTFGEFSFTFWPPALLSEEPSCATQQVSESHWALNNVLGSFLREGGAPVQPFRTFSTRFAGGEGWQRARTSSLTPSHARFHHLQLLQAGTDTRAIRKCHAKENPNSLP